MVRMAEAKRPFPMWSDDVEGIYTESEFLNYIGRDMSFSGSWSPKKFLVVFKTEDHGHTIGSCPLPLSNDCSTAVIKDKVIRALHSVDFGHSPSILVQFFAPVTIDGRRNLQSMNEPFGVTYQGKGLCSYRILSSNFQYRCSSNGNDGGGGRIHPTFRFGMRENFRSVVGPPSRVFMNGLPEYSPDIEFYSDAEYPSRDEILKLKIKKYLAIPVFKGDSKQCLGVLELVSTSSGSKREIDKPAYIFGLMSTALQGVGLRTSAYASHFDTETNIAQISTGGHNALREIQAALEKTCTDHKLPFAQTWTDTEFKGCTPPVLTTTSDEYYYQWHQGFSMFRDICESFRLSSGSGVVWKAFSSGGSCFCKDVGQLSISNYSLAHVARKVMLTSSFAICLKRCQFDTGYPDHPGVYIVELFLPSTAAANPQKFLEPIFFTMKKLLINFVTVSGQHLDSGITVEVLRVPEVDNRMELFTLLPGGSGSDLVGVLDESLPMPTRKLQPVLNIEGGSASNVITAAAGHAGIESLLNSIQDHQDIMESSLSWDGNEGMMQPFDLNGTQGSLQFHASISSTSFSLHSDTTQSMRGAGGSNHLNNSSVSNSWFLPDQDEDNSMEIDDIYRMVGCMDLNNESPGPTNLDGSSQQQAFFSTSFALNEEQYSFDTLSTGTGAESSHNNNNACALATSEVECSQMKKVIKNSRSLIPHIDRESIEKEFGSTIKEAARSLKVSSSTLKRRLKKYGINWPRNKCTGNGTTCTVSGTDSGKQNVMNAKNCEYAVSAENDTASSSKNQASPVVALPKHGFMIIKVQCWKDSTIKFQLPFSSQLLRMESEVAERLNLEIGSFKVCYLDEDDDMITLACDADMRIMESMGKSTIRAKIIHEGSTSSH